MCSYRYCILSGYSGVALQHVKLFCDLKCKVFLEVYFYQNNKRPSGHPDPAQYFFQTAFFTLPFLSLFGFGDFNLPYLSQDNTGPASPLLTLHYPEVAMIAIFVLPRGSPLRI